VHVVNLHLQPDVLRQRLSRRGTYDDSRVERKVMAAERLRQDADENIDVTDLTPEDVSRQVVHWLAAELRAPGSSP
jgi:ribose 1,5-bisphosphokinase PhnN